MGHLDAGPVVDLLSLDVALLRYNAGELAGGAVNRLADLCGGGAQDLVDVLGRRTEDLLLEALLTHSHDPYLSVEFG